MCSNIHVWYQTSGRNRDQSESYEGGLDLSCSSIPHFLLLHPGSLSSRGSWDVEGKVDPSSLSVLCSVVGGAYWWHRLGELPKGLKV